MDGNMAMPAKTDEMMKHLNHVDYPASKDDLIRACENMSDIPEEAKKWFMDKLPDSTFQSADEVKKALGMSM